MLRLYQTLSEIWQFTRRYVDHFHQDILKDIKEHLIKPGSGFGNHILFLQFRTDRPIACHSG